jgi:hypothetical protein
MGARRHDVGLVPAFSVDGHPRFGRWVPPVPPSPDGHEHVEEVPAAIGEEVLVAGWVLLIGAGGEDAVADERIEAVGEDVAGDVEVAAEVLEAADAEEGVPHDEQRPAVPDVASFLAAASPARAGGRQVG